MHSIHWNDQLALFLAHMVVHLVWLLLVGVAWVGRTCLERSIQRWPAAAR